MGMRRESQSAHPVIKNACWVMGYGDPQRASTLGGKINIAEALAVTITKTFDTNQVLAQRYLRDVILNSP